MNFPGTWMTESRSMLYRVVPKCACSTIGQVMYYTDNGEFFDGDVHDAYEGILKWGGGEGDAHIAAAVHSPETLNFSVVRNPYTRILSAFFDKVCGIQRNGEHYRGKLIPILKHRFDLDVGDPDNGFEFDQIRNFRRFLLFARDCNLWTSPPIAGNYWLKADIHWQPVYVHIAEFIQQGGQYDRLFTTERFNDGMQAVLDATETPYAIDLESMPRFNESEGHGPKRKHPVADYFDDDLSMHLMKEIYGRDFELFNYSYDDPSRKEPLGEIDLDAVHAKLKHLNMDQLL